MVTQRFWSSAIYLATSNSHASGIVGPRHDHMAIIHRQAFDKQASTQDISLERSHHFKLRTYIYIYVY